MKINLPYAEGTSELWKTVTYLYNKILLMNLTVVTAKQSILVILNDFKIAFRWTQKYLPRIAIVKGT